MVMWRHPTILAPFKGFVALYFSRRAMRPGISSSEISISLRPNAARLMSATLYLRAGPDILTTKICNVLVVDSLERDDSVFEGGVNLEVGGILLRAGNPHCLRQVDQTLMKPWKDRFRIFLMRL